MKRTTLMIILALLSLWGIPSLAQDNDTCLSCHEEDMPGTPRVNIKAFSRSIHGRNLCISCHADAKEIPHPEKLTLVSCATCHRLDASIYLESDHGRALSRGITQAATCTSCHGMTHTLLSSRDPKSPVHRRNIPQTCGRCHGDMEKMSKFGLSERRPLDTYLLSVHGKALKKGRLDAAVCSDCHGTHRLHRACNPESKIYRGNIPATCSKCHENAGELYGRSIHGKATRAGIMESPVCTDCHGEHMIRSVTDPISPVWVGNITGTCSACHDSEKLAEQFGLPVNRLRTYQDSYHSLAARRGDLRVANCASCHGWHDVLPSYDTESSVHPKNLPRTCNKCHPGAQIKLVKGSIHGGGKGEQFFLLKWARLFYLLLIPLLIGGMFIHNLVDFIRKTFTSNGRTTPHSESPYLMRMNSNERIQHGVLILTFTILAYSGFALSYPEAWWAAPFASPGGEPLRRGIHRWTAFVFVLSAIYHLCYMLISRRGRFLLKHRLRPAWQDFADPFRLIGFNLGIIKKRPELSYPSYIEKMEYWALWVGASIMIITGSLLVFSNHTLKYFPLWVYDLATLIHFYEAVLACLAIFVWHFYWTIFDPDVYPMSRVWLIGSLERRS